MGCIEKLNMATKGHGIGNVITKSPTHTGKSGGSSDDSIVCSASWSRTRGSAGYGRAIRSLVSGLAGQRPGIGPSQGYVIAVIGKSCSIALLVATRSRQRGAAKHSRGRYSESSGGICASVSMALTRQHSGTCRPTALRRSTGARPTMPVMG
jgi:hypothetical protein